MDIVEWLKNRLQWIMTAVFTGMASIIIALYTESKFAESRCDKRMKQAIKEATLRDSTKLSENDKTIKEQQDKIYELLVDWRTEYNEIKNKQNEKH